jgi:hypothetical protein
VTSDTLSIPSVPCADGAVRARGTLLLRPFADKRLGLLLVSIKDNISIELQTEDGDTLVRSICRIDLCELSRMARAGGSMLFLNDFATAYRVSEEDADRIRELFEPLGLRCAR